MDDNAFFKARSHQSTNLHKGYYTENTSDEEGEQKNHKNDTDIHLLSCFKGKLAHALVSV
jgi:hypothetical protein